ncbi:alpha-glucan family phosphorylase [Hahella ganghwensis]|uniref:alpha-glucan family phosphorylase n=1 Tax=Hahella ganghwensis TaxID=286420 RepID=UPI00036B88CC|nr:alpha-glucan family phosphorylase [Hahella ganghwensis]
MKPKSRAISDKKATANRKTSKKSNLPSVAYLCMEFAIDSSIKTYAGGLGILAGDYLKGAKEGNYPVTGVGLKWKQGYTSQSVDAHGQVVDAFKNHPYSKFEDTGKSVTVTIRQREVICRIWRSTAFGMSELILLDTDHPDNPDNLITGQLYGWFGEERVAQEIVLGVGGVKALQTLGKEPDLYHFNEGHAVLAALELIRQKRDQGMSLAEAKEATRKQCVFTTHTPIKEGNESHPHELLQYMGANLGLSVEELHEIGGTPFNMTIAALRLTKATNAVAQLHAETAEKMWAEIRDRKPIIGITNGIHRGTWVDSRIQKVKGSPDKLWKRHCELKSDLIDFVKTRTGVSLDQDRLLVGFARRAAPYKRSNLIFNAGKKVMDALSAGKIQIVFSGKAHPNDDNGKRIVEEIYRYSRTMKDSVVFLQDYDMEIGAMLTRGCDVWLNNPRRPLEACGTSGMKAAMNGVLNVSILDGWWPEACEHGLNGWAIGDEQIAASDKPKAIAGQDKRDARFLADILLNEVVPTYYHDMDRWIQMMQQSMKTVTAKYSVEEMLKQYFKKLYT